MLLIALFLATCFLAYSNGANDNFKGVASLFGCRAASYRTAITWATVTTFAGSITSIFFAQALLKKFSGKGLVPDAVVGSVLFVLAVAIGSILTMRAAAPALTLSVDEIENCTERYAGSMLGVGSQTLMDGAHFLSSGVVSFARGLNDTPKIVALLLLLKALDMRWGFFAVAATMALGGLLNARRVAETMSHRITAMNHGQGFSANLTTGILVILASLFGLPVSTTHVSVGALFGLGLATGQANPRVMLNILFSWIITLPCAALIGGAAYATLRHL